LIGASHGFFFIDSTNSSERFSDTPKINYRVPTTMPDSLARSERPTGQQILVTGGAGFIGSHLVDALVAENDVRVLDDLSSGNQAFVNDRAEFVQGDICDERVVDDAMVGVDLVYHQAASVNVSQSVEQPRASHETNVSGTLSILESARQQDARVVFASSAAIYGEPDVLPVTEKHPVNPQSPYGLEKLTGDRYMRLYNELYGVPTVPLRYFNVYGPRQTGGDYAGVITTFLDQAQTGEPLTIHGDGTQTRDFVHVDDVVQANLRAGTTETVGVPFNIGGGKSTSIRELARHVQSMADRSVEIIYQDRREGDITQSEANINRAREMLGYQPTKSLQEELVTLFEGL
jgi:UDP-glucose 4-epimerase